MNESGEIKSQKPFPISSIGSQFLALPILNELQPAADFPAIRRQLRLLVTQWG